MNLSVADVMSDHVIAVRNHHPAPPAQGTVQDDRRDRSSASSRRHRSAFFTGCLAAVIQPLARQRGTHSVIPRRRYWLSVCSRTSAGRVRLSSARHAAISSIRLLVVSAGSPPQISLWWGPYRSTTPHPPGPGLGTQPPSV